MLIKSNLLLFFVVGFCFGEFLVPEITLEAFKPKGFRASIPDVPGIRLFSFSGNLNKEILQADSGDYWGNIDTPINGRWSFFEADLVLKPGDKFHYHVFIEYGKFGFRKDDQRWTAKELVELDNEKCNSSETIVSGKPLICKNSVIFEDNFKEETVDERKWLVEEYIAINKREDFEFLSYQKDRCRIVNNTLNIEPVDMRMPVFVRGKLDLTRSCTQQSRDECVVEASNVFILPPVTSGRMISRKSFRYGKIEIRAKLPAGDWIYPHRIGLELDGVEYGSISPKIMGAIKFSESDTVRIVLGVGVGGINDFPDDFQSGNYSKPWRNSARTQLLDFFEARDKWAQSWGDQSILKVKSVKVTAL